MSPRLALSIDLDALDQYAGLYGLPASLLDERALQVVPALAAERFGALCDALGVKGTLFVVGRDVALGRGVRELEALAKAGHELASHSFDHDYALSRRAPERIDDDLARAEDAIARLSGARPVGFRAPGYTLSARLVDLLRARGYAYDSSLLPSPAYYAAKAAAIGALALAGRESRSILGDVTQLARPRTPHRHKGLLELPIATLPKVRVPFIGTLLTQAPPELSLKLAEGLAGDELVVIELHGVDLCDASDGVPQALVDHQRDLATPASVKTARLEAVLRALLDGREGVTLAEAARLLEPVASE
jgi:hypothetical protein